MADDYNVVFSASGYKRAGCYSRSATTRRNRTTGVCPGILDWNLANQYLNAPGASLFPSCGTNGLPDRCSRAARTRVLLQRCQSTDAAAGARTSQPERQRQPRLNADWNAFADVFYSNEKTTSTFIPFIFRSGKLGIRSRDRGIRPIPMSCRGPIRPRERPAHPIDFAFQSVGPRNYEVVSNTLSSQRRPARHVAGVGVGGRVRSLGELGHPGPT